MNNINLPTGLSVSHPSPSLGMGDYQASSGLVSPRHCCEQAYSSSSVGNGSSAFVAVIHALIDFVYKLLTKNTGQSNLSSGTVGASSSAVQSQPADATAPTKENQNKPYSMDWWGTLTDIFSNVVVGIGGLRSLPGKVLRALKKIF